MAKRQWPRKRYDWRKHYDQVWGKLPSGAYAAMAAQDAILAAEHERIDMQLFLGEVCPEHDMLPTLRGLCPVCERVIGFPA